MVQNKKYSHFYILKSGLEDGKDTLNKVYDNLSYREALKCFKQLRLEAESTATDYIHIILMGVITEDNEVIIKAKEISPANNLLEDNKDTDDSEEHQDNLITDTNYESDDRKLICYENQDIYFDSVDILSKIQEHDDENSTNDSFKSGVCVSEIIENKDKIEFDDYVDELAKSIKEIEKDDSNISLSLDDFIEKPIEGDVQKTLKSINLKDYYKHISEVDSVDIIKLLVDTFKLLGEKHKYNNDMITLLTKKRDCYCHDFEFLDKMNFQSLEERNEFILSLGANMHKAGMERRKFKNEYSITEKAFANLPNIRPSYYKPLADIENTLPEFDVKRTLNVKTYLYKYSTDAEKEALFEELNKKFDKVVDIQWGVFECYNKTGRVIDKKLKKELISKITDNADIKEVNQIDILGSKDKLDIIDEVSAKSYESIVNQVVSCGSTFLKTKGSSVKITNVTKKAVTHMTRTISHKYSKCAYNSKSKSLYLIKRL